ncbi:MAG TPA: amidohydrolase family protein [Acidimicrobiia bacterium]|nr:amidohydrolase family protein [Acidimicrobiia bacterium]
MSTHDLVVRGATVIDGTGAPGFDADVAVDGDRIVIVGDVSGAGAEELDGRGLVLAPGWIDTHTHLDANQFWDPLLTPCSRYGVSTVVIANCGYALAPALTPEQREYVIEALVAVEQVPRDAIDEAVPFDWTDQPSYVASLAKVETALNRGFLVGHLPVRAAVMGPEAARSRVAKADEIAAMLELVTEGLQLGALGFSTDQVVGNIGPGNTALPGQVCDDEELLAVAHALGAGPGPGLFTMAPRALLLDREQRLEDLVWHEQLAATSGKAVVIGPVFDTFDDPGVGRDLLDAMADAQARGNRVVGQVSPRPFELWTRLDAPGVLVRVLPTLHAAVKAGGANGVRRLAHDEAGMARLRAEGANIRPSLIFSGRWEHVHVRYTTRSGDLRDRDLATISAARGEDPTDLLVDIALNDDFETQFAIAMRSPDDARLGDLVSHRAAQLGGSDAGAHTQSNTDSCYAVWTLQHWVREREVLTLETAIAMLTGQQADLFGIRDRGRVTPGAYADLVLFDPDHIGIDDVRYVQDMPAGGTRLVAEPVGIAASIVNGKTIARAGELTGALPGTLLRAE